MALGGLKNTGDDFSPLSEINITPFVDVMLVLLIIFMVAAPLLESGIPIQLPVTSAKALPKNKEPITLHITKDQELFLMKEKVPSSQLQEKLKTFFANIEDKEIFIRADGSLPYLVVAKTMAIVKSAGIHKIGLVTLPEAEASGK